MKDALVSIGTDRSLAEAVRSELLSWQLTAVHPTVLILGGRRQSADGLDGFLEIRAS